MGILVLYAMGASPSDAFSLGLPFGCGVRLSLHPPHLRANMVADPRLSDRELAAINAAAVTREYNVQPNLGEERPDDMQEAVLSQGVFL